MRGELFIMSYSEYKALTPNCNADNVNEYIKALEWALKDDRIRNIAISGPYGSGKSSFIETFLFHLELHNEIVSNTCTMKVKVSDEGCEAVDYSSNDFCINCRAGYYRKNSSTKCELQPKG